MTTAQIRGRQQARWLPPDRYRQYRIAWLIRERYSDGEALAWLSRIFSRSTRCAG
jgi:hypothetical protein